MADHGDPKPPETKNTCLYLHDYTILGRRDIIFDRKGLTEMSAMLFCWGVQMSGYGAAIARDEGAFWRMQTACGRRRRRRA